MDSGTGVVGRALDFVVLQCQLCLAARTILRLRLVCAAGGNLVFLSEMAPLGHAGPFASAALASGRRAHLSEPASGDHKDPAAHGSLMGHTVVGPRDDSLRRHPARGLALGRESRDSGVDSRAALRADRRALAGAGRALLVKWLTEAVLVTCTWVFVFLGQAVTVNGDQLELAGQVVGVTEGCSGIRSTQSFLMVSLFLGEWMRLRVPSRVGMVVIALLTAYVTNVGRASFIAWTRFESGQDAFDRVHDSAGMVAYVIGAGVMIWVSSRMNTDTPSGRKLKRTQVGRSVST